jgi:hypothetical protein
VRELTTNLNHESYCHDKAVQDRVSAERRAERADARVAVLRDSLKEIYLCATAKHQRTLAREALDCLDPAASRLLARLKAAESALAHFTPLESLGEGGKCTFVMGDETLALIEAWRRACATEGDGDAD